MKRRCLGALCFFILFLAACGVHRHAASGVYHRVRPGETLYRIAKTYGVSVKKLSRVNRIADPSNIRAGDRLFIPGARRVLKVPIYRPEQTAVLERKIPRKETRAVNLHFAWPVKGKILTRFGIQDGFRNNGVGIAAPEGTPIRTAETGRVVYSGADLRDYGNLIIIDHLGSFATVYAHNRINLVTMGEMVKRGEVIAEVGMTGIAETPYLHFEIRRGGKARNPLAFLK
ncbi:MAG: peptidoglycan DD-metalloendopeptidase family protein [Candidatus Methylomirabilales bacterium]